MYLNFINNAILKGGYDIYEIEMVGKLLLWCDKHVEIGIFDLNSFFFSELEMSPVFSKKIFYPHWHLNIDYLVEKILFATVTFDFSSNSKNPEKCIPSPLLTIIQFSKWVKSSYKYISKSNQINSNAMSKV